MAEETEVQIANCNRDAARANFLTMQEAAATLLKRAQKAEAERDELMAANDAIEIDAGFTDNGNLWRFWSKKSGEIAGKHSVAKARILELETALRPFAEYLGDKGDLDNLGQPLPDEQGVGWIYLTMGDFRRARSALPAVAPTTAGQP